MYRVLILCSLATLAACATPLEQCLDRVTRDLRVIDGLIAESRATLARGYAIETETRVNTVVRLCADHKGRSQLCYWDVPYERRRPVAVNLSEERAKLHSLEAKRKTLARQTARATGQCRARYPE